jgi:transcriptional regulator
MYTPPMFKPDRAASLAFAEARGFGTACAWDGTRPVASALPFYLSYADDGTPQALFHVARNNLLIKAADGVRPSADQVPTWLYQAVHLTGPVRVLSEAELVMQIDTLSAKFENRLVPKKPWTSAKMTAARLEALKKGIVGLAMQVEDVEGSFKLNQHKSEADYAAVAGGLAAMPDEGSQTIARLMREARPQAFATTTTQPVSPEGSKQ